MCGILGYIDYSKNSLSLQEASLVKESLKKLTHRGPNNTGFWQVDNCALGHTRLSILDLSEKGNQPFKDPSGRYSLIFNGEIFNFQELKEKYLKQGFEFNSQSDTEVLLYCLISQGEKVIKELNGFFSFAFIDHSSQTFIVARDQFGIKPLFFYYHQDIFAFSSELRPLISILKKNLTLSLEAIFYYFTLSYIPHPYSLFEEIQKVLPGHYLKISKNSFELKSYYQLNSLPQNNENSIDNKLNEMVYNSVNLRLNADVKTGAFLSGGVDSSIVVSVASQIKTDLKTFSVGFKNNSFDDETKYARMVAKKYNTDHYEFFMNDENILETMSKVLDSIDEPFSDTSAIPTFFLCESVKSKATVFLSGDGADELFAGYNKHSALNFAFNSPAFFKVAAKIIRHLPSSSGSRENFIQNLQRQKVKFQNLEKEKDIEKYLTLCQFTSPTSALKLFANKGLKFSNDNLVKKINLNQSLKSNFNNVLENDFKLVLANDMLTKVDMMSMANSIEVRPVFLDLNLVDYVFQLDSNQKIDYFHRKKILINSFKKDLPKEIYTRSKKGFSISIGQYLNHQLKGQIDKLFDFKKIQDQNIFDIESVKQVFAMDYKTTDGQQLKWSLVVLQHWLDKNFFI